MRELTKLQTVLMNIGAVMTLAGATTYLFFHVWSAYVYIVGILLFAFMQVRQRYVGINKTLRRLFQIRTYGTACLVLCAILMLMNGKFYFGWYFRNEWIAALAIGSFVQVYTAWRIPNELEKEKSSSAKRK